MFLENLEKYLHKDRVVGYVTVEPPIFPSPRVGKIIKDFGDGFENFDESFFEFARQEQENNKNQTEEGITFFSAMSREVFLEMGGFDNIFNPMFMEDTDLIRRIEYQKLKCFTSRDSITNHFVSKTSRFSEEYKERTKIIENNSQRNYLRKWGSMNSENKFNVGFIVENCTRDLLYHLEPWIDRIYVDTDTQSYIKDEQINTSFDLRERVHTFDDDKNNDILISFDGSKLDNNNFEIIKNIQNILRNTEPGETYEIDIFNIYVHSLTNYIQNLIFIQK
jgi:GT2 family glycosyltransferase